MARIFKRGKSWVLDFSYKGTRVRKVIGKDKKTAELALKDVEVRIAREEHLGIHESKRALFEDFAKQYLEYSRANKAEKSYERDILSTTHLAGFFGGFLLSAITVEQIERYKSARRKMVSPATVNRELACLSHMFSLAVKWELISSDPTKGVKKFKEPPGRLRFLSCEEIARLLCVCASHIKPVIIIALNTGMRKSEILNLRWEDVDLVHRRITIRKTKNNEMRIIPINELLYDTLCRLPSLGESEWLFPGEKCKPIGSIKTGFRSALRRAGIKDFRFHDLRHTFASHLIMNGASIRTVQELLGHKDIKMTMRYAHLSREHVQLAVENLGKEYQQNGANLAQNRFDNIAIARKLLPYKDAPVAQLDRAPDYECEDDENS